MSDDRMCPFCGMYFPGSLTAEEVADPSTILLRRHPPGSNCKGAEMQDRLDLYAACERHVAIEEALKAEVERLRWMLDALIADHDECGWNPRDLVLADLARRYEQRKEDDDGSA